MEHFPLMARFNEWVNGRVDGAVAELPEKAYRADEGLFFGSAHNTLNHILAVDRMWTARIEGVAHGLTSLKQILYDDFDTLQAARKEEDGRFIRLVDGMDAAALNRAIRYTRMIGTGEEEIRTAHILPTLFNHQTHHRGQVTVVLTRYGIEYPPLDVAFFLDDIGLAGPPGTLPD